MSYESPGYQRHSDTSREAADRLTTAQKNQRAALDFITAQGAGGATIDEVCVHLSKVIHRDVPPNAISGRFIELENKGLVSKTPMRRKTRGGRNAVVYVAGSWTDLLPPDPHFPPPPQESQLAVYKRQQAVHGHGHVIPRDDGRREGCGGVGWCKICKQSKAYFDLMEEKEKSENGS